MEKVLLAILVTHLFLCSNWPCYYRLVYCNTFTYLQEHLSSVTMIFVVTLVFALVTLHIMVECIVCNTFTNLSEHLRSVTVTIFLCCNRPISVAVYKIATQKFSWEPLYMSSIDAFLFRENYLYVLQKLCLPFMTFFKKNIPIRSENENPLPVWPFVHFSHLMMLSEG